MTHPIVKTVSGMVYEGDIDSAERALAVLADEEGDFALARVIEEMPARDVVAILREHDSAKISIISELISPKQFLAAITLERDYGDRHHDALKGMVNAVVFADESKTDGFIEVFATSDGGLNALADYFGERHEEVEFFFRNGTFSQLEGDDFTDDIPTSNADLSLGHPDAKTLNRVVALREVQDHDWRELAWRLRCEHYDTFRDLLEVLRSRHHRAAAMPPPPPPAGAAPPKLVDDEDDVL
jgi:hypothetical protein